MADSVFFYFAISDLGSSLLEYSGQRGKKTLSDVYVSKKYEEQREVELLSLGMGFLSFTF